MVKVQDSPEIRSRKFLLTFQASQISDGWTHGKISDAMSRHLKGVEYWAMCDETGNETHSLHTHLMLYSPNPVMLSTVKNVFPHVHTDVIRGTLQETRDYLLKSGKYAGTEKAETSIPGSFEEYGQLPAEPGQGSRSDLIRLYNRIKEGATNAELLEEDPRNIFRLASINQARLDILTARYQTQRRLDLKVIYVQGKTGLGKSRMVLDEFGDEAVYRVTDYTHPFDTYTGQPVMVFEEFRQDIPIGLMLNYLDVYPLQLPARYSNKVACYKHVYLVSNWHLEEQYQNEAQKSPDTYKAFLRRIHTVRVFSDFMKWEDYAVDRYLELEKNGAFCEWAAAPVGETPFSPDAPGAAHGTADFYEQECLPFT